MMGALLDDEATQRFAVYSQFSAERRELEYTMYFARYEKQSAAAARPPESRLGQNSGSQWYERRRDAAHVRRYFQQFYESFLRPEREAAARQMAILVGAESSERGALAHQWRCEIAAMCRGFARVLGSKQPSLLLASAMDPASEELVTRRVLEGEYFAMLQEACVVQETLVRRTIVLVEEADDRKSLVAREVPDWIEARRLQVEREKLSESQEAEETRTLQVAYFRWLQQQQYQVFLLEQSERQEREAVARRERLEAGAVAGQYSNSFRSARHAQLMYEDMRRALDVSSSRDISTSEAIARSEVLCEQRDAFRCLAALEVRSYLTTSRHEMQNERVELM